MEINTDKCSVIVIALTSITTGQQTTIKKDIANILKARVGDDILFILDENGRINVRKDSTIRPREKFLSSATVCKRTSRKEGEILFKINVSTDVMKILEFGEDRKILWILDENGDITLRNTFLFPKCTEDILGRDISAMIISLAKISTGGLTNIPKDITDILNINIGDTVTFNIDEFDNIMISTFLSNESLQTCKIGQQYMAYFSIEVRKKLKADVGDNILWIFDENGNIIIKNAILPDICY